MHEETDSDLWPFEQLRNTAALTMRQIMDRSEPILLVSHDLDDGGWQFIGRSDASMENVMVVSLESVCHLDSSIFEVANLPLGWEATRSEVGGVWNRSQIIREAEDLVITPIPSLIATLLNRESAKGSPLTQEEVEEIRDQAPSVALTPMHKAAVDEARGYLDIDPDQAWAAWQVARLDFGSEDR